MRDLQTEASVGLHAWERHAGRPTRLVVNVELFAEPAENAAAEAAAGFIDYEGIRAVVQGWRGRPHVDLLETLAHELAAHCLAMPRVLACRVSVAKPDVFNDAAAAGVELTLRR